MSLKWTDNRGVAHGDWCREKFCRAVCKFCRQETMYFECSHGSKVYFHKIPSEDGEWDATCPARNTSSASTGWQVDLNKGEFDYKINLSNDDGPDYRVNLSDDDNNFKINLK